MSEIAVTVLKVAFLALLWLFILSATSVIRTDMFGRSVEASELSPQPEPVRESRRRRRRNRQPTRLVITNGPQEGVAADLADGLVLIGRSSECQIILDDDYVSTRHARVAVDQTGGFFVEDLGSTNGTYVNGRRLTHPTAVTPDDSIRIGRTVLKLEA